VRVCVGGGTISQSAVVRRGESSAWQCVWSLLCERTWDIFGYARAFTAQAIITCGSIGLLFDPLFTTTDNAQRSRDEQCESLLFREMEPWFLPDELASAAQANWSANVDILLPFVRLKFFLHQIAAGTYCGCEKFIPLTMI